VAGPPCAAGEHSRELLRELGLAGGEIESMIRDSVTSTDSIESS
jgi:hypothetical protein